jgi:hypothetical protein
MEKTNQLVCGAHNVPLIKNQIPIDMYAPGLGKITCYVCPVSQTVARETKVDYAQK